MNEVENKIQRHSMPSILNINLAKADQILTVDLDQEHYKKIQHGAKRNCKILKISTKHDFGKIEEFLKSLKSHEFLHLFIFIIDAENFELFNPDAKRTLSKVMTIQNMLLQFSRSRPMILQMSSKVEDLTKFYCKEENSEEFKEIDLNSSNDEDQLNIQPFFSSLLSNKLEILDKLTTNLLYDIHGSLILRFLQTLNLSKDLSQHIEYLIPECAQTYTKGQLLAVLDAPFENYSHMLSEKAQVCLNWAFFEQKISVLSVAVEYKNVELVDFLIENFSHLIQQLPRTHQIEISTAAFDSKQIRILCDLIQCSDFPFPEDFEPILVDDERLKKLAIERQLFHAAIKAKKAEKKKFEQIEKFIDSNSNLKMVYGIDNKTALCKALDSKKFEVFFYLKSLGFQATEYENYEEMLSEEERKEARKFAYPQIKKNVKGAIPNENRTVMLLTARSRIHNIKLNKENEELFHEKIKQWFTEVYASEVSNRKLLDVAAQCDDLIPVFDFQSEKVENINFRKSLATTHVISKWIMIGAKGWDGEREQQIKGAIAHEMCHYGMKLVFENKEYPYHKKDKDKCGKFDGIVNEFNKWTSPDSNTDEKVDDECEGIISTVYTFYNPEDWHAELIVRVAQIHAQYDNDPQKVMQLEVKYDKLFDYHRIYVVPEMEKFNLKSRENIRKLNNFSGLLPELEELGVELANPKDLKSMNESNDVVVVVTNSTRLFMLDYHQQNSGIGQDNCAFVASKDLAKYSDDLKSLQHENQELKILVDCTNDADKRPSSLKNLILVVKNENQFERLKSDFSQSNVIAMKVEANYKCKDVTDESLRKLMEKNVEFQTDRENSLFNSLTGKDGTEQDDQKQQKRQRKVIIELDEAIDVELLNLLLENSKIFINTKFHKNIRNNKFFKFINQPREFNKKGKSKSYAQHELIKKAKNKKFMLISDIAGSGKSWALKSIAKEFIEKSDGTWVIYVDLKQFIKAFNALQDNPEFLKFMVDHVLKDHQKFEAKIFEKLYEKGKVVVLFDGFDEIAPNYCQTVVDVIKSFESNGGNQMWIATRDYFEVDLKKELKIKVAYNLEYFHEENGIEMVSKMWILHDLEQQGIQINSAVDFENSQNFESYQKLAKDFIEKLSSSWIGTIGFPQLYKMVGEISKDDKDATVDLNNFKIYHKFVQIQSNRWSHEKGALREEASTNVQTNARSLNFAAVHQFTTLKSYFPEEDDFCGLKFEKDEWPDEEIIACGLMTQKRENFYFPHETFREYFAADFIVSILKRGGHPSLFKFLIKFLKNEDHQIIRMFINDALEDDKTSKAMYSMSQHLVEIINEEVNEYEIFFQSLGENHPNLISFLINSLKNIKYEKVKKILNSNIEEIMKNAGNAQNIIKIQEFFIEFLNVDDLRELLYDHAYLIKITKSCKSVEVFKHFMAKIEEKFSNEEEPTKFLKEAFINDDNSMETILHACAKSGNKENLEFLWQKIENLLEHEEFKEFVMQNYYLDGRRTGNILHVAADCKSIEFFESLWNFLLKSVGKGEELEKLILEENRDDYTFIHKLVEGSNIDIFEFTFKILKENFTNVEIQKIFLSKNHKGNMLQLAVEKSTSAIFNFLIDELEKISSREEMRNMLTILDYFNKNLLQKAKLNESIELHQSLWKFFEKYFENSEIIEFIKHVDDYDDRNLIAFAISDNKSEIAKFTLNKINNFLSYDEQKEFSKLRNGNNYVEFTPQYFGTPEGGKKMIISLLKFVNDENALDLADIEKMNMQSEDCTSSDDEA